MARPVCILLLFGVVGCANSSSETALVPSNPFVGSKPQVQTPSVSPATEEASMRVATVGQKVLAANPQLKLKPYFATIGPSTAGPAPEEVFHTGDSQIVVTETLARKCQTDGQLAAVLAVELAKISAERDSQAANSKRMNDNGPPNDVPVGSDARGTFGPADGTRAVELAKYDQRHGRGFKVASDPKVEARAYLARAGFPAESMDAVLPLLRTAEQNGTLEKQMAK